MHSARPSDEPRGLVDPRPNSPWRRPHRWVKLDRLGRNTRDVLNLVHELEEKGAGLRVLEPAIDTGGPMGRMVLTVLGMVAQMELGFIRDRQRAGIDAAKAK